MTLRINPGLTVLPFDGASASMSCYCEVPLTNDEVRRLLIPEDTLAWLREFDGERSVESQVQSYLRSHPTVDLQRITSLTTYFVAKGVLLDPDRPDIVERKHNPASYVRLKVQLLPASVVRVLSVPISLLFGWRRMLVASPLFLISHLLFYLWILPSYHINLNDLHGQTMLEVIGVIAFLGIIHELGHAAALAKFGYEKASIGWGVYLAFTVFWTDLSDAWKLRRWERAMVDVGGIYLHLISLCLVLACISLFHSTLLVYCFYLVDYQLLTCLNPLLRTDAFWFASDAFGIPDLREQSLGIFEQHLSKLMPSHFKVSRRMVVVDWRINLFIAIYTGSTALFAVYFAITVGYELVFVVAPAYPHSLAVLWNELVALPHRLGHFFDDLIATVFRGLALYGLGSMLARYIRRLASRFALIARSRANTALGSA